MALNRDAYKNILQSGKYRSNEIPAWVYDDKDIMMHVVKYGTTLQIASSRLKNDYDLVYKAVKYNDFAIRYASTTLKANKNIALRAVNRINSAYYMIDSSLRTDEDIVLAALSYHDSNGYICISIPPELLQNKKFVLKAVENPYTYIQLLPALKNDLDIIHITLQYSGTQIRHMSPNIQANYNIALKACENTYYAIECIPRELQLNKQFILDIVRNKPNIPIYCIPSELLLDTNLVCEIIILITSSPNYQQILVHFLNHLPYELYINETMFIWTFTIAGPIVLSEFDSAILQDPDIIKQVVSVYTNNTWGEGWSGHINENILQQFTAKLIIWKSLINSNIPPSVLDIILIMVS